MSELKRIGTLEIDEDPSYQRRFFKVQKAGWALMAALIAVSMLGYFGGGPLTGRKAGNEGTFWADYQKYGRARSDLMLTLHASPMLFKGGTLRVRADREYMKRFRVLDISPRPAMESYGENGIVYVFHIDRLAPGAEVSFRLKPEEAGKAKGAFGSGGETIEFDQFIYP